MSGQTGYMRCHSLGQCSSPSLCIKWRYLAFSVAAFNKERVSSALAWWQDNDKEQEMPNTYPNPQTWLLHPTISTCEAESRGSRHPKLRLGFLLSLFFSGRRSVEASTHCICTPPSHWKRIELRTQRQEQHFCSPPGVLDLSLP